MTSANTSKLLSQREREVLYLIAFEYTNKEIGKLLYLSTGTIATYRKKLLAKLSAKNTAGIVRIGFELGILSFNEKSQIVLDSPTSIIKNIMKENLSLNYA